MYVFLLGGASIKWLVTSFEPVLLVVFSKRINFQTSITISRSCILTSIGFLNSQLIIGPQSKLGPTARPGAVVIGLSRGILFSAVTIKLLFGAFKLFVGATVKPWAAAVGASKGDQRRIKSVIAVVVFILEITAKPVGASDKTKSKSVVGATAKRGAIVIGASVGLLSPVVVASV
jgi:hypothetical protein